MKSLSLLLAAVVIVFSFPACASKSTTAQCCSSGGSCDAPTKATTEHAHSHAKKKSD